MVGSKRKSEQLLFLLPAVLYVSVLLLYPVGYNVNLSLRNVTLVSFMRGTSEFIGLENYISFLRSREFLRVMNNTLIFYTGSVFFQLLIGFFLSILFMRTFPLHKLLRSLVLLPLFVPVMVSGNIFRWFLSEGGALNGLLVAVWASFGSDFVPIRWITESRFAIYSVTFANIWIGVPFNFIILFTGLQGIPNEIYECAQVDGANAFQRHLFLTIPMLRPVIVTALLLGSIFTLKLFDLIWIITRGGPGGASHLFSTLSYSYAFDRLRFGQGAAIALIMISFIVGVVVLIQQLKDDV